MMRGASAGRQRGEGRVAQEVTLEALKGGFGLGDAPRLWREEFDDFKGDAGNSTTTRPRNYTFDFAFTGRIDAGQTANWRARVSSVLPRCGSTFEMPPPFTPRRPQRTAPPAAG